ncbi:helix-turn-helix domain-containing protein [Streptomyces acidiscabies]|uniref:Helix-turn-helix transcriptional regulator n=1 Tax=Streptomyces acidiscabies TaxID=42234 RepID=A0AAP6EJX2_9ACTN|nr:helix-turn-helix transcriptional regulator [Streptomyces acidiscabies]MBP5939212.1 helix-turn-helix domain-containing protein [Streptomyces sp. LBUM 1476]MBZ3910333.1 helix-turn-helix transcriptional regulator [Streptomyces acidiscabies]MDX2964985.1 helix-turn-helix transcriptional regulator [Streptomyces acidiscabies]MDX3024666.1 helix-turn-helix transcriptional regulator [Streptomyces acidiscabies]MDX3795997.1 helix-turn-helix transcriptional regulator [Streptomyces acidiscabies]
MTPRPAPTARRLRIGTELRRLRERAGMPAVEAARSLGTTQAQISNIEANRFGVSADRVHTLAHIYGCTDQPLVDALAVMAADRTRGWWAEYRDTLPPRLLDLAELEHHATALRVTQVINIPGLLQTPEHARALFREAVPALRPHEIEFRISHRIKRQAILHREQPPPYTAVVHEAALRMQFGGREVARDQLRHLAEVSGHPAVTLRVIPFDGTSFPTTGHAVDYFHGPVPALDTVEVDTAHGSELVDAAGRLEMYRLVLDRMEAVALKPAPSLDLIHRIARDI